MTADCSRHLYQDGPRYWYSTQPTVTKKAKDRAEQLTRDPDKATGKTSSRIRRDLESKGGFNRIHPISPAGRDALIGAGE
ncbi:MAG: hypothetical protein GX147_02945 [Deltaproteobacteria bacterium]|nr:hypothetical protein [Deltaproteobacteria bacterium]